MEHSSNIPAWVWALAVLCIACAGAGLLQAGCGAGKTVCQVIDVAKHACDTLPIRYLGPDGKEHTVLVPKSMLVRTAEAQRIAQAKDAGAADGGTDQ